MKIHIVEDDWGVRDALVELVRELGHPVLAFGDGESFLQTVTPAPEDLVFVDLGLPGMSGVDVVKRLKLLPAPPRVVAISGQPRLQIERSLRDLRGDPGLRLLRKPLAPEAITALL
jgi:CheY-like chemotaxis protein